MHRASRLFGNSSTSRAVFVLMKAIGISRVSERVKEVGKKRNWKFHDMKPWWFERIVAANQRVAAAMREGAQREENSVNYLYKLLEIHSSKAFLKCDFIAPPSSAEEKLLPQYVGRNSLGKNSSFNPNYKFFFRPLSANNNNKKEAAAANVKLQRTRAFDNAFTKLRTKNILSLSRLHFAFPLFY